eukprot:12455589-Alexandrium_andersonii.AAC.1
MATTELEADLEVPLDEREAPIKEATHLTTVSSTAGQDMLRQAEEASKSPSNTGPSSAQQALQSAVAAAGAKRQDER